jgi:hypothetical protein
VIREDRERLAKLARLNREMAPLPLRIMEGSASVSEQRDYAQRLIAAGEWLRQRADKPVEVVIDGEVLSHRPLALPELTAEPHQQL